MMSGKLVKYLFPKFYKNYISLLQEKLINKEKISELKKELKDEKEQVRNIEEILKDNNAILGIEQKDEFTKIIIYRRTFEPHIFIVDLDCPTRIYIQILASYQDGVINTQLDNLPSNIIRKIHIDDIYSYGYENKGFGSIAMKYLITMAQDKNIYKIYGFISPQDKDNIERLEHFYKKFGFEINSKGNISKKFNVF